MQRAQGRELKQPRGNGWRDVHFFAVGIGGALGGGLRHALTLIPGATYPAAILAINIIGALALPVIANYLLPRYRVSDRTRLLITTGAISSFTTFSAITGEMVERFAADQHLGAGLYLAITLAAGLCAAALGQRIAASAVRGTEEYESQRCETGCSNSEGATP